MWFEQLPEQCPPSDATLPSGDYFRLISGDLLVCDDFQSHRMLAPLKVFNVAECVAHSLSVFTDLSACESITKLPIHRGKKIVKINLDSTDGAIKKTGKDKSHFSWWRSHEFDFAKAIVVSV